MRLISPTQKEIYLLILVLFRWFRGSSSDLSQNERSTKSHETTRRRPTTLCFSAYCLLLTAFCSS